MTNYLSRFQLFSQSGKHLRRLVSSFCCCPLLLIAGAQLNAQVIDSTVQEHLDTITDYYQTVRNQLPGSDQQPAATPASTTEATTEATTADVVPEQVTPISTGANSQVAAYTPAGRDPFAVTPVMLENENYALKQAVNFTPLDGNINIPNMKLKGIITGGGEGKMAALLEIEGMGVFVVREGDNVGLYGIGNNRDVIQIESISRLSLIVRTGTIGGAANKRFVVR